MFIYMLSFLKKLSFIDYVLFFTVIFLLILIVSLIYFIKVNEDDMKSEIQLNDPDNLKQIASLMEKSTPKPVEFTSYEREQEDKAIISYDELLESTGEFSLNYLDEDEKNIDKDISVKKVDLNNIMTPMPKTDIPKINNHIILLRKEEEFLEALKELQKLLI